MVGQGHRMIIDSYAWIEYFFGSKKGMELNGLLGNPGLYTLESNLAEIYEWALRNNDDFKICHKIIVSNSNIIPINRKDWLRGVELKAKMRVKQKDFGMLDALMLAKQEELGCKIITGDPHFKGMKNVVFLK